jgi:hypothetical protein
MLNRRGLVCFGLLLYAVAAWGQAAGVRLGDLSWPEAERRFAETPVVILPFGAGAKEHGPHIPRAPKLRIRKYSRTSCSRSPCRWQNRGRNVSFS